VDTTYVDRLAPINAPEAWLAVMSPGREDSVVAVAASEDDLDLWGLKKQCINWIRLGHEIVAMKDSPSLQVHYPYGLYSGGANPAHLKARKNWFLRYRSILESHLSAPRAALVYFYERKPLPDLLCTMRSTKDGPFPFLKDADWPRCEDCHERMAFIGTLDFRGYHRVGKTQVPKGCLVLHGCDQCTIPCTDDGSGSVTWLLEQQQVEMWGSENGDQDAIEIGVPWETIEFPSPAFEARDLSDDPAFSKERGIDQFFTSPLDKVGGHLQWIQGDYTPTNARGAPMRYIGQLTGSRDIELGDGGIVYLFYSEETDETRFVLQYY
jgi:hypothetical protein